MFSFRSFSIAKINAILFKQIFGKHSLFILLINILQINNYRYKYTICSSTMDKIQKIANDQLKNLDDLAKQLPYGFHKKVKDLGAPPGAILGGAGGIFLIIFLIMEGYNIVCAILTCLYPMWMSVLAIQSKSEEEAKTWLSFWCVYGLFQTFE